MIGKQGGRSQHLLQSGQALTAMFSRDIPQEWLRRTVHSTTTWLVDVQQMRSKHQRWTEVELDPLSVMHTRGLYNNQHK